MAASPPSSVSSKILMPTFSDAFDHFEQMGPVDILLIITGLALITIGILASIGIFDFIGTTNATYLAYSMYGGTALLFISHFIYSKVKLCQIKETFVNEVVGSEKEQRIKIVIGQIKIAAQDNRIEYLTQCGEDMGIGKWSAEEVRDLALDPKELSEKSIEVHALSAFKIEPGAPGILFFKNQLLEAVNRFLVSPAFRQRLEEELGLEDYAEESAATYADPEKHVKDYEALKRESINRLSTVFIAEIKTVIDGIVQSSAFIENPLSYIKNWKSQATFPKKSEETFTADVGKWYAMELIEQYYQEDIPLYLHSFDTL